MLSIQSFVNHPVTSNCYVLYDRSIGGGCIIIDPGSREEDELLSFLLKEEFAPKYIILTHEHFDHCWGVNQLLEHYDIPIICSLLCAEAIKNEKRNCSVFYDNNKGFTINSKTVSTESINHVLKFGTEEIEFFSTPGHTDASISFVAGRYLFTGDTLIKDMRTVTKLPTGSIVKLKDSIALFSQFKGKGMLVYAGHGSPFELDECELQDAFI